MKGKAFIPLVLGLCVGLVAVKFLVDKIQNAKGSQGDQQTMTIVRVTEDIGSYKALRAEMLEVITVPDSALVPPRDRIEKIEDVVGRVTSKSIPQFAPLLKSMLADEGTLASLSISFDCSIFSFIAEDRRLKLLTKLPTSSLLSWLI